MSDQAVAPKPSAGPLAEVAQTAAQLGKAAKSANTRRAYDGDWRAFRAWCAEHHLGPLPAAPATVGLYIAALGSGAGARSPTTIERALAGIAHQHRMKGLAFDRRHPAIADVLAGLKRTRRRAVKQSAALMPPLMRKLLEVCGEDLPGLRDRAILLLGFSGALRRSELVGVDVEHLKENRDGYLLTIPWAKTDQEGQGIILGIPRGNHADVCPVQAIKEWLYYADIDGGPVFRRINRWGTVELDRLGAQSVALIVKRRAQAAGLAHAEIAALSGHSLRAGFVTTAYDKDVPEHATQRHARHKKVETTRRYNRVVSAFKGNPAKGLLE
jgi:integrase